MSKLKCQIKSKAQMLQFLNLDFDIHLKFDIWILKFLLGLSCLSDQP